MSTNNVHPCADGGLPQSHSDTSTFDLGGPHPRPGDVVLHGGTPRAVPPPNVPPLRPRLELDRELPALQKDERRAREAAERASVELDDQRRGLVEIDAQLSELRRERGEAIIARQDHRADRAEERIQKLDRERERQTIRVTEATKLHSAARAAWSSVSDELGQVRAGLLQHEARDVRLKITAGREERNLARARRLVDLLEEIGQEDVDGRRITGPGFKRPGPLCAEMRYLVLQEIRRRGLLRVQGPNCAADVEILSLVAPEYLKQVAGSPAPALGVSTSILTQAVK